MSLLTIIIVLVVVGFVMWLINAYIPMARSIKSILNIVVTVVVIWWLLSIFGIVPAISGIKLK